MKERAEEITDAQGPRRPRAQARARRDPRHRVRGAAAPARARPPRRVRPLAHHARRARRSSPTAATSSDADADRLDRRVRVPAHRRAPPPARRRAADPHHPVRRAGAARAWRGCSATATARSATALERVRGRAPRRTRRRCAAIHERLFFAPLLDTLAGAGPLSPEAAEERLAAFGFPDVERTRAALRELTAGSPAARGVMQQLLPVILDWLSETPDPDLGLLQLRRLAEGPARSRVARGHVPRLTRCRRAHVPPARLEPRARRRAAPPTRVRRRARRRRRRSPSRRPAAELVDEALDTLEWRGDARSSGATGCAGSSGASCCASRTRDLLGFAALEATERELTDLAEACVEAALRVARAAVAVRRDRHGPPRRRRAVVRVRHRRAVRVRRRQRRRLRRTPSTSPTQLVQEIGATTAEGQTFRIDARAAARRQAGPAGALARRLPRRTTSSGG